MQHQVTVDGGASATDGCRRQSTPKITPTCWPMPWQSWTSVQQWRSASWSALGNITPTSADICTVHLALPSTCWTTSPA
ncbi:hypothetical protein HaLaN_04018, partial [Haematococcus lacustris]